jgi:hypothetical protein
MFGLPRSSPTSRALFDNPRVARWPVSVAGGIDRRTETTSESRTLWSACSGGGPQYRRWGPAQRRSLLFKGQIVRLLDARPYSVQEIFQRSRATGFQGGVTIVKDYGRRVCPKRTGLLEAS